ncbi:hypothetical protein LSAT2_030279 [Lamellibrachia satsuma]|nr:hypothetical protein LSAT2_030279 [Lamellibrachia satsuma]
MGSNGEMHDAGRVSWTTCETRRRFEGELPSTAVSTHDDSFTVAMKCLAWVSAADATTGLARKQTSSQQPRFNKTRTVVSLYTDQKVSTKISFLRAIE